MRTLGLCSILVLVGCRAAASSSTRAPELLNAGFESGALAQAPALGWYSDDVADGRIRAQADTRERVEGRASLALEIVRPRAESQGLASLSQTIDLGPESRGESELELSLALKAAGLPSARLVAYVWDAEGRARTIAEREIVFAGTSWERALLRFRVPREHRHFGIFVYLPSLAGGRLWLDDASLHAADGV